MGRFIALLRGINISGKNKIAMPALRMELEKRGFRDVRTYLNSGNVVFSRDAEDALGISEEIARVLRDVFLLDVPVLVVLQSDLARLLARAPEWWAAGDEEMYDNLIFLIPPLSLAQFMRQMGEPRYEFEKATPCECVVFWSFVQKFYQKTNWWSKTASCAARDGITIRTANTVKKIVQM